jgi:hypothetical protein
MSTFEELEAALEAAAQRHYGRRRSRVPRFAGSSLAVACVAVVVVLAATPAPEDPVAGVGVPPVTVPASTLAVSHALTLAPRATDVRVPHASLAAVAREVSRAVPYPPGMADTFDWAATPDDPQNMSSINYRVEVESLIQYRASCLWVRFWVSMYDAGNAGALAAATRVLADVPSWPALRFDRGDGREWWTTLAAQAAARDPGPLRAEVARNC